MAAVRGQVGDQQASITAKIKEMLQPLRQARGKERGRWKEINKCILCTCSVACCVNDFTERERECVCVCVCVNEERKRKKKNTFFLLAFQCALSVLLLTSSYPLFPPCPFPFPSPFLLISPVFLSPSIRPLMPANNSSSNSIRRRAVSALTPCSNKRRHCSSTKALCFRRWPFATALSPTAAMQRVVGIGKDGRHYGT